MKSRNLILLVLFALLITPVLAVAPTSNFYLVPTDMKVYLMPSWDAAVYQDGLYTVAVNRMGGIINATLISVHTDDIPIQAAIDYTATIKQYPAQGGIVFLTTGYYTTSQHFFMKRDITLQGAGRDSTYITTTSTTDDIINNANVNGGDTRMVIRDLSMGQMNSPTIGKNGIFFNNATYAVIENVRTEWFNGTGIHLSGGYWNRLVNVVSNYNDENGVLSDAPGAESIQIIGGDFEGNTQCGVHIATGGTDTIQSSYFEGNHGCGAWLGSGYGWITDSFFNGNSYNIYVPGSYNHISGNTVVNAADGIIITGSGAIGNIVNENTCSPPMTEYCIHVTNNASYNKFIGNLIYAGSTDGIRIDTGSSNNTFYIGDIFGSVTDNGQNTTFKNNQGYGS